MTIIFSGIFIYFFLSTLYVLVLSLAAFRSRSEGMPAQAPEKRIAILIPAYKEDAVIVSSAKQASSLNYPPELFQVVVIADSLQPATLRQLQQLPVKVIEVTFEKSTKAKALNRAMEVLPDDFDIAIISDGDNVFEKHFLHKINAAFCQGKTVVQGRRMAKNLNTPFAVLDACSEAVNNHIFRKGANALGLSSALIGSGMAFRYHELKEAMLEIDAVGGFDRMLQLRLIERGNFIYYMEDALVYDEKVADPVALENQRRRWNASQYQFLRKYFLRGIKMFFKGELSYFNLAILNSIFLSRILNVGFLFFIAGILTFSSFQSAGMVLAWWSLLLTYILALLLAMKGLPFKINFRDTVLFLPKAFFLLLRSNLKMAGANRQFIHTPHSVTEFTENSRTNEKGK